MTTGVIETKIITPNASVRGLPPTDTELPMANARMNVEAMGPEETLPLSKESPTNRSGTKKESNTANA
ncbi:hypothetical protein SDC9_160080 [bioreactor metagenome]|uniref:Uncharacterized protein n=1 Tax=bioreactor metagenome TaxID=1076179 RepID=A0A645FFP1_9ZZZZ